MFHYRVFGGTLRSTIELPELTPTGETADHTWEFETAELLTEHSSLRTLGSEPLLPGMKVTLVAHSDGLRLDYDDTGSFDVLENGRRIVWQPPGDEVDQVEVRKDLLGRVFSVALHQSGLLPLHGSAVKLGTQAVGFIAPKKHGKSTTATALVAAGGALLSDDVLAVDCGPPTRLFPGIPTAQLWPDSALYLRGSQASRNAPSEMVDPTRRAKEQISMPSATDLPDSMPLGGLYLLNPMPPDELDRANREAIPLQVAPLILAGQTKVAELLDVSARADQLDRACTVAEHVPLYRLDIPRDLEKLPDLINQIFEWHGVSR